MRSRTSASWSRTGCSRRCRRPRGASPERASGSSSPTRLASSTASRSGWRRRFKRRSRRSSMRTWSCCSSTRQTRIPILTKADLRSPEAIAARAEILAESEFHRPPLSLSVRGGHGLSELREVIERTFAFPLELHLVLPEDAEAPSKLNWLYEHAEVVSVVHGPDRIEIVARCRLDDRERIERLGRVLLSRSLE